MLLDVSILRLLNKDDFRVLRSIELGMRNHEIVPIPLIVSVAKLRASVTHRCVRELLKHKLVHHENVQYDGYRLTTSGYDFLAIHTLVCRHQIHGFGRRIGTGKESDVYEVTDEEGNVRIMKIHRLGRISFRAVKNKRDYLRHRRNYNWLYLSRLAALGEFAFMSALFKRGFPVPEPIDQNRHVVLMSVVDGYPLSQIKYMEHPSKTFKDIFFWFVKFVEVGLVHCDFNEFNLMINENEEITIIDFPQMVSTWHENAEELFDRDRDCIITCLNAFWDSKERAVYSFFQKRFNYVPDEDGSLDLVCPTFQELVEKMSKKDVHESLDAELQASGFKRRHRKVLDRHRQNSDASEDASESSSQDSDAFSDSENDLQEFGEEKGTSKQQRTCMNEESKSSTKSDDGTEEHDVKERSKTKQKEHKQIKVKKQTMAT